MYTKDIAPEVMAQKIYDLAASGLDRGLIEDICGNASKLSIFNDEVVAILKRIKTENPSADIVSLIKNITDDVDGPDWLYTQIHIDGMHDISGPGVYELYYSVVDRDGNFSNRAKLMLTVQ